MVSFAHVTDGAVDQVGTPPRVALVDGEWVDLRSLDLVLLASVGWFPIVREPRPADTASTTWDRSVVVEPARVLFGWAERPKSQAELDEDAAAATREQIEAAVGQALEDLRAVRSDLGTVGGITNATINVNPAPYIKQLAQRLDVTTLVLLRTVRFVFGKLDDLEAR